MELQEKFYRMTTTKLTMYDSADFYMSQRQFEQTFPAFKRPQITCPHCEEICDGILGPLGYEAHLVSSHPNYAAKLGEAIETPGLVKEWHLIAQIWP